MIKIWIAMRVQEVSNLFPSPLIPGIDTVRNMTFSYAMYRQTIESASESEQNWPKDTVNNYPPSRDNAWSVSSSWLCHCPATPWNCFCSTH